MLYYIGDGTDQSKNIPTQIGSANNWKDIAVGHYYVLALKTDGTLWAWGGNIWGQLGIGTSGDSELRNTPTQVGTSNDWKNIATGNGHSLAIKTNGTLWAWGNNNLSQLGDGTTLNRNAPIQIGAANDWKSISGGDDFTLALKTNGTLWAWGNNAWGQLGIGDKVSKTTPVQVGMANDWKSIDAASSFSSALKTDGTLWEWGGCPSRPWAQEGVLSPVKTGFDTNWKEVTAAGTYMAALKTDGTVWAWGIGALGDGALGSGGSSSSRVPKKVASLANCTKLGMGGNHIVVFECEPCALPTIAGAGAVCAGSKLQLTGSSTTGTVRWTSSNTNVATVSNTGLVTSFNTSLSVLNTTISYTVTEGDCVTNITKVITVNPVPVQSIVGMGSTGSSGTTNTNLTCYSPTITLMIGTFSNDGSVYRWSTGQSGTSIRVASAGTYSVTATNTYGCADAKSVTVMDDRQAPIVTITPNGGTLTCATPKMDFTASGGSSYSWSTSTQSYGPTTTIDKAGSYSVTVTGKNGCRASKAINVTNTCTKADNLVNLMFVNGALVFPTNPSLQNTTYRWYLNGNLINGANSFTYSPVSPGTYRCEAMGFAEGVPQMFITNNYVKQ
jgi:trimeric autotransporter adhesin